MQTAVIAMPLEIDASIDPLQSHEAVLVSYQGETWIVTTKGRHAIDLTDRALTSSMGIPVTARPTPISEGMFNALPDMGPGSCRRYRRRARPIRLAYLMI